MDPTGHSPRPPVAARSGLQHPAGPLPTSTRSTRRRLRPALPGLAGAGLAVLAFRRGAHRRIAVACCVVSTALALPATQAQPAPPATPAPPADEIADRADREQVGRIQKIDISMLDPTLAGRSFSEWLHDLAGADGRVYWETNDCGEGGDGRESPTCVEADVKWRPCGTLSVAVGVAGTEGKMAGAPEKWGISLSGIGVRVEMKSLHEIPGRLREARALDAELRAHPEHHLAPGEAIEAAKRIEMRVLDERVGPGSFGEWIAAVAGPGRPIRWRATGCTGGLRELYLGDACDDSWACVEAEFADDHELVNVSVRLGTVRRGLIGKPAIDQVAHYAKGPGAGVSKPNLHPRLHELPTELISARH